MPEPRGGGDSGGIGDYRFKGWCLGLIPKSITGFCAFGSDATIQRRDVPKGLA
jgi:hypothetical protein